MVCDVWQDREVRFDVNPLELKLRGGEKLISQFEPVEDTKGNFGEVGCLTLTNLRLIWQSIGCPHINLSIGYNCIIHITSRLSRSNLKGTVESLVVLAKISNKTTLEFFFNYAEKSASRMFTVVEDVFHSYEASKLYRDVKLRCTLIVDSGSKQLKILPLEQIYRKVGGVYSLANEEGNIGTLFVTNIRIVWFGHMNATLNVSIPYLQIKSVGASNSIYGATLVLKINKTGGGFRLGFRIDPPEKMDEVLREIQSLHKVYASCPIFGVDVKQGTMVGQIEKNAPTSTDEVVNEDVEIESTPEQSDAIAAYMVDSKKTPDREPVFSEEFGLMIEKPPAGYSLSDLWELFPSI